MNKRTSVLVLAIALMMAACSPGDASAPQSGDGAQEASGSVRGVIDEVALMTGETALGKKPLLQWSAVDGAAEYSVVVRDADGEVYWAWRGAATEVAFGGGEANGPVGQTAYLHQPMTWTVVAYDEALLPLAISAEANLAP